MEFLCELFMEFCLEFWMELAMKAIPGCSGKKAKLIAKLVAVGLILYVIIAFVAGGIMLSDGAGSRAAAIILMVSAVGIALFQIVSGIVYYRKKR